MAKNRTNYQLRLRISAQQQFIMTSIIEIYISQIISHYLAKKEDLSTIKPIKNSICDADQLSLICFINAVNRLFPTFSSLLY